MDNKRKLALGLDIGIASVGWGIIDIDTGEIVDEGVRIFPEAAADNTINRRTFRGSRRLTRRRSFRVHRMKELLIKKGIINNGFVPLINPYEIRVKGLTNKLSNEELATALLHLAKRRGSSLEIVSDDKEVGAAKKVLQENEAKLKNKYVCELQYDKLLHGEVIRDANNNFKTKDYLAEIETLLRTQGIKGDFHDKIIELIAKRRHYSEGPGGKNSPSPYGRYLTKDQEEPINLIEKMRGHCSVYPEELRAPKMSYTADLFNLLNDLNNLKIGGRSLGLPSDKKKEIIEVYINKKGNITPIQLARFLNLNVGEITGFRENKKGKELLTEFDGYKTIMKIVDSNSLNPEIYENKLYVDKIIDVLTSTKVEEERIAKICDINGTLFTRDVSKLLASITGVSQYHAFSYKALNEFIDEMMGSNLNQMQIITNKDIHKTNRESSYKGKKIPFDNEAILSPVVKRATRQTFRIVDALIKKYGNLDTVVVELAREKNSADLKKTINDRQAYYEKLNLDAQKEAGDQKLNSKAIAKYRLYKEQDGKSMYSGKDMDLNAIFNNPDDYEIDHIIPISISFDNSQSNKCLVFRGENQLKGNRTPKQVMDTHQSGWWDYNTFKATMENNPKISKRKRANLFFEDDISKYQVKEEFLQRNLVDTRYACRYVMNTFQDYFKANDVDTKVEAINGQITHNMRNKMKLPEKDRDVDYHHAIDALVLASLSRGYVLKNRIIHDFDPLTGEITNVSKIKSSYEFYDNNIMSMAPAIQKIKGEDIKISYQVDKKVNRSISDQTVYGTRDYNGETWVIKKYKDIYGEEGKKLAECIKKGKGDSLLCYRNDPETYSLLEKVVNNYTDNPNPLLAYK
ncbi:MAG: type II CRISPR RNA-guided endonuclease Cas9, partial [Bacilli bacterium]|nr:type II CRISPR RNA-guided endonuclease Cas9 [Bacilli bacterium]